MNRGIPLVVVAVVAIASGMVGAAAASLNISATSRNLAADAQTVASCAGTDATTLTYQTSYDATNNWYRIDSITLTGTNIQSNPASNSLALCENAKAYVTLKGPSGNPEVISNVTVTDGSGNANLTKADGGSASKIVFTVGTSYDVGLVTGVALLLTGP